jgi:hypothetical protein
MLGLLVGFVALGAGCDMGSMMYFLMPETREPAILKDIASPDQKNDTRVVIVTWAGLETRHEIVHADRELAEKLGTQLTELVRSNKGKLTVVPPRKVEQYKNTHPRWREMELADIGRQFDADYVIFLELHSITLYEPASANQLFRGRVQMTINLVDVHHPDDPQAQKPFSTTYPSDARGPVMVGFDSNVMQFREQFLTDVARSLSYYFAPYAKRETYFRQ